jgi:hypothetical protein
VCECMTAVSVQAVACRHWQQSVAHLQGSCRLGALQGNEASLIVDVHIHGSALGLSPKWHTHVVSDAARNEHSQPKQDAP